MSALRQWLSRVGRKVRYYSMKAIRENASPSRTALGLGLGVFVGIFPSFLIGTPLSYFLAAKLGLNRAAAVAGSVLSLNPITAPFIYSMSAWLGLEILGREIEQAVQVEGLLNYLSHYAVPFLVGNAVIALTVATVMAGLVFVLISNKKKRVQPAKSLTRAERVRGLAAAKRLERIRSSS